MKRAIRKHWQDFAGDHRAGDRRAVVGRLHPVQPALLRCRAGCRSSARTSYTIKAEISTAQAVTPGQGQTVKIAGVAGRRDRQGRSSKDGRAVVDDEDQAASTTPIYRDATVLLRPKTGLKDMVVELDPGTRDGRRAARAAARSRSRRRCRTSTPTRSSPRWTRDTRDYLQLLLGGGGAGPARATARRPRATFRRFEPTGRDLAQDQRAARRAAREHRPLDPQLPPAHRRARRQGHAARAASSTPPTPSSAFAEQDANLRDDAAAAAGDADGDATRSPRPTSWPRARPDARRPAARRPRARARRCSQTRPFLRADDADHPGPAAAVRARRAARRSSAAPGGARPRRGHAGPDEDVQGRQLRCSTSWPTTRRARRRASSSGRAGPTTPAPRSSPPRTRTARSAAACRARRCATLGTLRRIGRGQPAARHARPSCSTRPTDAAQVCPSRRRQARRRPRAGEAWCRSRRPASAGSSRWSASRCPASACCCSCGWPSAARSRSSRRATLQRLVPRGRPARAGGRRADLRRAVGKVKTIDDRQADGRYRRRRSSSSRSTRRCRRTRGRSCARRRCSARPTSS